MNFGFDPSQDSTHFGIIWLISGAIGIIWMMVTGHFDIPTLIMLTGAVVAGLRGAAVKDKETSTKAPELSDDEQHF